MPRSSTRRSASRPTPPVRTTRRPPGLEREGVKSATVYGDEAGFVQSEHSASLPKETVRFCDSLARAAGVKIQMAEATGKGGANGWYSNGIIHIANDAENPGTVVAKHEITHRMQEMAPEAYRKYRDYAMSALTEWDGSTASIVEQYKSRYAEAGVNLSTEQAMDEIAADFTEALTVDPARFETLAKENRSVARKLLDAVRDFIRKVKSLFKGNKTAQNQAAANGLRREHRHPGGSGRLWEEALKATSEQTANKNAAQTDGRHKILYQTDLSNDAGPAAQDVLRREDGLQRCVLLRSDPCGAGEVRL